MIHPLRTLCFWPPVSKRYGNNLVSCGVVCWTAHIHTLVQVTFMVLLQMLYYRPHSVPLSLRKSVCLCSVCPFGLWPRREREQKKRTRLHLFPIAFSLSTSYTQKVHKVLVVASPAEHTDCTFLPGSFWANVAVIPSPSSSLRSGMCLPARKRTSSTPKFCCSAVRKINTPLLCSHFYDDPWTPRPHRGRRLFPESCPIGMTTTTTTTPQLATGKGTTVREVIYLQHAIITF